MQYSRHYSQEFVNFRQKWHKPCRFFRNEDPLKSSLEKLMSRIIGKLLFHLKKLLSKNRTFRNALNDISNVSEFSNLFEHEKMLADQIRVQTYRKAIETYIKPGQVVVDLGTGTGILAIYAARQHPRKVYAIDHSNFITIAEKIAIGNDIHTIDFQNINSRNFKPPEKVDVILHEQIGDELFEENMIENLLDLKKRILKEGGYILPGRFEFYVEPVSLKPEYTVPYMWDNTDCGIDFSTLANDSELKKTITNSYRFRYLEYGSVEKFMGNPHPILSFDLNDDDFPARLEVQKQTRLVVENGALDGFCTYFNVIFDDEIHFDTSPKSPKTSWGTRLIRTDRKAFKAGDSISYELIFPDFTSPDSWSVNLLEEHPVKVKQN
jgi:type I protein arginine methyltransferase